MIDKELLDKLTEDEKINIKYLFEKELHTLVDCYSHQNIEQSAKELLTTLAKAEITLRLKVRERLLKDQKTCE